MHRTKDFIYLLTSFFILIVSTFMIIEYSREWGIEYLLSYSKFSSIVLSAIFVLIGIHLRIVARRQVSPIRFICPKRVVVMMPKLIGEVIMATSFLKAIRELYERRDQNVKIDLVMTRETSELMSYGFEKYIDNILIYDRDNDDCLGIKENFFDKIIESTKLIISISQNKYDFAVILTCSQRNYIITAMSGITRRFGYKISFSNLFLTDSVEYPYKTNGHCSSMPKFLFYSNLAYYLGYGEDNGKTVPYPKISVCPHAGNSVDIILRRKGIDFINPYFVCVAPGSGNPKYRWPAERYAELVIKLRRKGFSMPFVFTFGPSERDIKKRICEKLEKYREHFYYLDYEEITLPLLVALISKSIMLITNDTSPLYIARVTGTWALAINGPTSPLYHRYMSIGKYKMVGPEPGKSCSLKIKECDADKRSIKCNGHHRTKCINLVTVDRAFLWASEMLNRSILNKKIDVLIKSITDQDEDPQKAFLRISHRIGYCRKFIKMEIPKLSKKLEHLKDKVEYATELKRLAFLCLLIGDDNKFMHYFSLAEEKAKRLGPVSILARNKTLSDINYPFGGLRSGVKRGEFIIGLYNRIKDTTIYQEEIISAEEEEKGFGEKMSGTYG